MHKGTGAQAKQEVVLSALLKCHSGQWWLTEKSRLVLS